MRSIHSLLLALNNDYPEITFHSGTTFAWNPATNTITYAPDDPNAAQFILHEVAHASLHHDLYDKDIELLQMERDAWSYTTSHLSKEYGVTIDNEVQEEALESYREWLHSRSICPRCTQNGIQTTSHPSRYHCLACKQSWSTNEAKNCALRRYHTQHASS